MNKPALVFVDVETTGLVVKRDAVLEVGFVVVDADLNELKRFSSIVAQPHSVASLMNEAVLKMHTESGLWDECTSAYSTMLETGDRSLSFFGVGGRMVEELGDMKGLPMCGSTIRFDRNMLAENFPDFESLFFYRSVDVSSFLVLNGMWDCFELPEKRGLHRVIPDIEDSINLLRAVRRQLPKRPG